MSTAPVMVGRDDERRRLADALARCCNGAGGVVLVSGDAGVGKTRLVDEVLATWEGRVLRVRCVADAGPFAPMLSALGDSHKTSRARGSDPTAPGVLDRLRSAGGDRPTAVVMDDLHLADAASIGLLPELAVAMESEPILVVGVYRSDELPRGHAIRAARTELRRGRQLADVTLRPLTEEQTGELLAGLLAADPAPELVRAVHARTEGLPFFIEEIASSLGTSEALQVGARGVTLSVDAALPLPESVVDAVLARVRELCNRHGLAVEYAAVLGARVDLPVLAELAGPDQVDPLLESGLLLETDREAAIFRHGLVRDALYRSIPWARRREHHRRAAELLTRVGTAPAVIAGHWLGAHEPEKARPLLLSAAEQHCRAHAYRDAVHLLERALSHWPDAPTEADRTEAMARLAECAELGGDAARAVTTWEVVARRHETAGDHGRAGLAHRRAATAAEVAGDLARSVLERVASAEAFARAGQDGDAAAEHLSLAENLKAAGRLSEALEHAELAGSGARTAGRRDVEARALGLQGALRSALGEAARGVELARSGLDLALAERLHGLAGPAYYELAEALEYAADYAHAVNAYESAFEVCRAEGLGDVAQTCFACMSPVVRLMGDWDRTLSICEEVLADETAPELALRVAEEESGLIHALRGDPRRARGRLRRAAAFGGANGIIGLEIGALWGLALVAELEQGDDLLHSHVSAVLDRARHSEECHYTLPPLRWAASLLAERGDAAGVATCHRTVAELATRNSAVKVLSALAHVGAELALVEGDATRAGAQFARSVELLNGISAPYEQSHTRLRWGTALSALGDREEAVAHLIWAYRTARRLRAKPLHRRSAEQLAAMGEQVDRRLGRLAAREALPDALTRREREVLQLLAGGRTNREIAAELFLSTRTVDMHVRNLLTKLGCTSRTAAVQKAAAGGLIPAET